MAAQPPLQRDVTLEALARMAIAFDEISDEDGARWPAARFVEYVRAELAAAQVERREPRRRAA